MHNVGLVWSYLGLEDAIQRKVLLFWGIVVGSENGAPEAGNKKCVAPIIYGYDTAIDRLGKHRRRQPDASPSLPSLAARLKSRLVRHNTFETHLPHPDTTVEVVLRRH